MPPRWLNIFTCSITQAPSACPADCSPRAAASRICAGCFCDCCSAKFLLFDRPTLSHQRWRGTCWRFGKLSVSTHEKCVCLFKLLEPHVHALKRTLLSDILSAGSLKNSVDVYSVSASAFEFFCCDKRQHLTFEANTYCYLLRN
jgi:hypothetical protein